MQKRNQLPARHELKYFIHPAEVEALRNRLRPAMTLDSHCVGGRPYVIRSLYFDDIDDSAYYDKEAGVSNRDKYRIRIYRHSDQEIFIERKRKLGDLIQKSSTQITRRLCDQIVSGDPRGLYRSSNALLQDLYVQMRTRLLRPRVIVDYEREAYLHPAENVRITFDLKLRLGAFQRRSLQSRSAYCLSPRRHRGDSGGQVRPLSARPHHRPAGRRPCRAQRRVQIRPLPALRTVGQVRTKEEEIPMNNVFSEVFSSQTIGFSSILTVVVSMLFALGAGYVITMVYRRNYRGVMYSGNFALSLLMMTVITTPVVLCIRNSIALSMGMVGALSIVRFRTAVKDPLDTAYMFWALTTGILLGAGQFLLTVLALVMIAGILTLLVNFQTRGLNSYLLVVRAGEEAERTVSQIVGTIRVQKLKSKTVSSAGVEMTYEVRVDKPDALLNRLQSVAGVQDATLVSYQGETA